MRLTVTVKSQGHYQAPVMCQILDAVDTAVDNVSDLWNGGESA